MVDPADLLEALDRLGRARVVVVGDAMLDRLVTGTVERVSPEAPVPVLRVERETATLGGAGNVLRNLVALGARATLFAAVGDDPAGREMQGLLAEPGAGESRLVVVPGRTTTVKRRYLAGGQQLLRADRETRDALAPGPRRALLAAAARALEDADALVLSDYGKGALTPDLLAELIGAARAAGRPVVVDPQGGDYARYRGARLVAPNLAELGAAAGLPVESDEEVVAACRGLIADCGLDAVAATRSERGMTLVERDGRVEHLPAEAREVFDVTGAGDTVVAVLGAALGAGVGPGPAARLANAAAGIVVAKAGTAAPREAELRGALRSADRLAAAHKVAELEVLLARARDWRRAGLCIGFTNGCFDLLHPGHLSTLRQARAACDRLVVALNSDASVRRLKGDGRPVQGEAARALVLAALADVDHVVVFAEDTPLGLIEALRPDLLVKGGDYRPDQVVGADLVRGYGGRVLLTEVLPGYSTTRTIERL